MDYSANSNRSKKVAQDTDKKKVERVVKGKVKRKKKGELRKFTDAFVSEEVSNVKTYILDDVLIPTAKKMISEIITNSIDMILYGEPGHTSKRSNSSRVSYSNYYDRDRRDRSDTRRKGTVRGRYNFDDIYLDSRGEAEEVLQSMDELLDNYGIVSVADLCDLVGINGQYTDNKYGWTNLASADVIRTRDGYTLKLPRVVPIN